MSFGLISQLERGLGNPSFLALKRLAEALGIPLARLRSPAALMRDELVVRAARTDAASVLEEEPASQLVIRELLTPGMHSSLQVIRSTLPPGFYNEGKAFQTHGNRVRHCRVWDPHGRARGPPC